MLVIRLQRTGRSGHAMFRIIVQDSRRTPTSGNIVAQIGHYDPHQKTVTLDKEKAKFYIEHGAQPSPRVIKVLKSEGVKLPKWVAEKPPAPGKLRNPEKLRRNRPAVETPVTPPAPEEPAQTETVSEEESPAVNEEASPAAEPVEADTAETPEPVSGEEPAKVETNQTEAPAEAEADAPEVQDPEAAEPEKDEPAEAEAELPPTEPETPEVEPPKPTNKSK